MKLLALPSALTDNKRLRAMGLPSSTHFGRMGAGFKSAVEAPCLITLSTDIHCSGTAVPMSRTRPKLGRPCTGLYDLPMETHHKRDAVLASVMCRTLQTLNILVRLSVTPDSIARRKRIHEPAVHFVILERQKTR